MVGSPSFSMKNETLHLFPGFNNIQHILTNQIVPPHIHCIEKREELSAQLQEGAGNCPTQKSVVPGLIPLCLQLSREWLPLLSLFIAPPPPHMREQCSVFSLLAQNMACQGLCYFEVCILYTSSPQASIRYGSCLLDSYFLDWYFQMHFVCQLDGFHKN